MMIMRSNAQQTNPFAHQLCIKVCAQIFVRYSPIVTVVNITIHESGVHMILHENLVTKKCCTVHGTEAFSPVYTVDGFIDESSSSSCMRVNTVMEYCKTRFIQYAIYSGSTFIQNMSSLD